MKLSGIKVFAMGSLMLLLVQGGGVDGCSAGKVIDLLSYFLHKCVQVYIYVWLFFKELYKKVLKPLTLKITQASGFFIAKANKALKNRAITSKAVDDAKVAVGNKVQIFTF